MASVCAAADEGGGVVEDGVEVWVVGWLAGLLGRGSMGGLGE